MEAHFCPAKGEEKKLCWEWQKVWVMRDQLLIHFLTSCNSKSSHLLRLNYLSQYCMIMSDGDFKISKYGFNIQCELVGQNLTKTTWWIKILNLSQNFWPAVQQYDMSHTFQQTLNDEIYDLNILLKSHHLLLKISYKNVIHNFVSLHFHFWGIWASIVIPHVPEQHA